MRRRVPGRPRVPLDARLSTDCSTLILQHPEHARSADPELHRNLLRLHALATTAVGRSRLARRQSPAALPRKPLKIDMLMPFHAVSSDVALTRLCDRIRRPIAFVAGCFGVGGGGHATSISPPFPSCRCFRGFCDQALEGRRLSARALGGPIAARVMPVVGGEDHRPSRGRTNYPASPLLLPAAPAPFG